MIDAETVVYRLEEAGRTLLALPKAGCYPGNYKVAWPEVVHAAIEAYGWDGELPRAAVPAAAAITRMDEAWRWVSLIREDRRQHRRIVLMRSLVNPITERHQWSYRRIGKAFGWDYRAVQRWHEQGIDMIVVALRNKAIEAKNVPQKINAHVVHDLL